MAPRGRPPLPVGTYGEISIRQETSTRTGRTSYRAKALFRDADGVTRPVVRYGQTKGRARDKLKTDLAQRQHDTIAQAVTRSTTLADLAALWLARNPQWSTGTRETYEGSISKHVEPRLGAVRIGETNQSAVHRALAVIRDQAGAGAAKTAKTVLSGMFQLAMQEGAMQGNPALRAIRLPSPRKHVRALTVDETDQLIDTLRASRRAVDLDLPDIAEWMLGTGCRIGEAFAARAGVLDLDAGTWEINATLKRVKGAGLVVQERPKTAAGWRVLALPSFAVAMAQRRHGELRFTWPHGVLFGSPYGATLRDPSNTAGDLREVLDRAGFDWVTSHVFRKTVATRLEEAGLSPREVADQLGHARPSMTMDVYFGRNVVSAKAASALDR